MATMATMATLFSGLEKIILYIKKKREAERARARQQWYVFLRPKLGDAPTIACPSMCAVGAGKISEST